MKLASIRIENFRSFKDETVILDDYNCFVGPNGAGKSTVFNALNVFFRQYKDSKTDLSKLSADDFHHKDTSNDIKITVTFRELSDKAKEDLSDYVRQDKLVVTAVAHYDPISERAEVKQYGNRLGISAFRKFFEAIKEGAKVGELKEIFASLRASNEGINDAKTKDDMISSLHDFETRSPDQCHLIPSEDQFYGITKGANKLSPHVQWVFIPASKDILAESHESKTTAFGQLLARTVRSKIDFRKKIAELKSISEELEKIATEL